MLFGKCMILVVAMAIFTVVPSRGRSPYPSRSEEALKFSLRRVQEDDDRESKAILVKFVARNEGDKTITFSKIGLPLLERGMNQLLNPHMLRVTYENCRVWECAEKYFGLIALRHARGCGSEGADCVTLEPGESVSHVINLGKYYAFKRAGKYYAQVGGTLRDVRLDDEKNEDEDEDPTESNLVDQLIISNRVRIDVEEENRPVIPLDVRQEVEEASGFCADDVKQGGRYDCGKQMGMGAQVSWTVKAKNDGARMSVSLNGYGNVEVGWSKVGINGMEKEINVLQDRDVHEVAVRVNRGDYEVFVDGMRALTSPVLRRDVIENEERGFGQKIFVDVKEMSGISAKYLRADGGSPPVEDAAKATEEEERGKEEAGEGERKNILNPCEKSLDELGIELQKVGVSGAVDRSEMTQDVRMSYVNADGETETQKVKHVSKETLALVGHTSTSMSKMLKHTHKVLRTKKGVVLIYGDNTVVTAKLPTCEISHIYFPQHDGSLNTEISSIIGTRLSVAVDKPSPKPAPKPKPTPRPTQPPLSKRYGCSSGKTVALQYSNCGKWGTPPSSTLAGNTQSASSKVHSSGNRNTKYFGSGGDWKRVDNTWNNMKSMFCQTNNFASKKLIYKCLENGKDPQNICRSDKNTYAYVWSWNSNPLNIQVCAYWNKFDGNKQAGFVVHEVSHFNGIGRTDDVVYGCSGSLKLSTKDKRRNADNYRFAIEGCPSTPSPTCVGARSLVRVKEEKSDEISEKELGDISVGDVIETVNGFENVWYIVDGGKMPQEMVSLGVRMSDGSVQGKRVSIDLTPDHLLFDDDGNMKRAQSFDVGDGVEMFVNGASVIGVVSSVGRSRGKVLSVVTHSGEFLLSNGIRVSSYSHSARFAKVIHILSWPFRWMSRLIEKNVGKYVIDALSIDKVVNPGAPVGSMLVG